MLLKRNCLLSFSLVRIRTEQTSRGYQPTTNDVSETESDDDDDEGEEEEEEEEEEEADDVDDAEVSG